MEKMVDMQQNQMADDELVQISGGKSVFDVFTAEFNDRFVKPKAQNLLFDEADKNSLLGARTLEMRVNDKEKHEGTQKAVKL